MKKDDAEREIRTLMQDWRRSECPDTPPDRLSPGAFRTWLASKSLGHMNFKSPITGVTNDINMWFDDEFEVPGR